MAHYQVDYKYCSSAQDAPSSTISPVVTSKPAGAPSLVNGGGAVGASDLLTAPSEMFGTDMSVPIPHLAQQVLS